MELERKIPQQLESQRVYDGFVKVRQDTLLYPSGYKKTYDVIEMKGDAVAVFALTPSLQCVLTREYRHPAKTVILGIPGGYIDEGEDVLQAAKREFLEETGYSAAKWKKLGEIFPYAGATGQRVAIVCALDANLEAETKKEPGEVIETVLMSQEELLLAISQGVPLDGNLTSALFYVSLELGWR